jgi:hypothetical protein
MMETRNPSRRMEMMILPVMRMIQELASQLKELLLVRKLLA